MSENIFGPAVTEPGPGSRFRCDGKEFSGPRHDIGWVLQTRKHCFDVCFEANLQERGACRMLQMYEEQGRVTFCGYTSDVTCENKAPDPSQKWILAENCRRPPSAAGLEPRGCPDDLGLAGYKSRRA